MKKVLNVVLLIGILVVIALLWRNFLMPDIPKVLGNANTDHLGVSSVLLAAQASQFALLQIHLALLTIILAVAALWGYSNIKDDLEKKMQKRLDEIVPEMAMRTLEKMGPEELARRLVEMRARNIQKEDSKRALNENISEILGGTEDV